MLGRKRIPKSVRIVGLFWAIVMVVSLMSTIASASTIQRNINYSSYSTVSSSYTTNYYPKDNSSDARISNYNGSSTHFKKVYVLGNNGSGYNDCTKNGPRVCYIGESIGLPNKVYPTYDNISLRISYDANPYVVLKGHWQANTY